MYFVKATALSGRPLEQKIERAQDAYDMAKKWIAAGFTDVALREDGKIWHYGAADIRQFIVGTGLYNA